MLCRVSKHPKRARKQANQRRAVRGKITAACVTCQKHTMVQHIARNKTKKKSAGFSSVHQPWYQTPRTTTGQGVLLPLSIGCGAGNSPGMCSRLGVNYNRYWYQGMLLFVRLVKTYTSARNMLTDARFSLVIFYHSMVQIPWEIRRDVAIPPRSS